jgi:hypothetical protein
MELISQAGSGCPHRHHVHALARERIEVSWEHGHQRLALSCAHLSNLPLMEDDASNELDVERTQPKHAVGSLPGHLRQRW